MSLVIADRLKAARRARAATTYVPGHVVTSEVVEWPRAKGSAETASRAFAEQSGWQMAAVRSN